MASPADRAARDLGIPDLAERLASLPGSAWTSLLLDVARRRAERRTPSDLMAQFGRDDFVRPSAHDQRDLHWVDGQILAAVPESFETVELSPVAPLATVSATAKAHQNKVCSAQRSLEVVSDPTNALALIAAERRRAGAHGVRLFTSHRALRMQRVGGARSWQHFRLAGAVTAGAGQAGHRFELEALVEHLGLHLGILDRLRASGLALGGHRVTLCIAPSQSSWADALLDRPVFHGAVAAALPEDGYYRGVRFVLDAELDGEWSNIADGGLVDWLEGLCASRRERLCISAIGTERLAMLVSRGA